LGDPTTLKVMDPNHLSNQPPAWVTTWVGKLDGWALNLGAGGTAKRLRNLIELEYHLFRHTDVSADAHHLPFRDACFDAVVTFNTFEHLHDPPAAAREIYRVLKPGGRVILHTAFLQPLHEAPYHYYNATEFGVRKWFEAFDVRSCKVSDNFNPLYVLSWFSSELLAVVEQHLGPAARSTLENSRLRDWADGWANPQRRKGGVWEVMLQLPLDVQTRLAAGFELDAFKPLSD
jgi:SAM-dependent methyltransferase